MADFSFYFSKHLNNRYLVLTGEYHRAPDLWYFGTWRVGVGRRWEPEDNEKAGLVLSA